MSWFEALVLGILQGLTEYLPVSSSGHLTIGSALFGIEGEDNLTFTIVVHVATVLSTLVILWKEIDWIFRGLFKFQMNAETKYVINIIISMIPIGIVGVFFKDTVEERSPADFLLLCQTAYQREYQPEGCFHHRYRPGMCCHAGTFTFRYYHCHRSDAGRQERETGTVLISDGHSSHLGRSFAGRHENHRRSLRKWCGSITDRIDSRLLRVKKGKLVYFGIYCAIVGVATIIYSLIG